MSRFPTIRGHLVSTIRQLDYYDPNAANRWEVRTACSIIFEERNLHITYLLPEDSLALWNCFSCKATAIEEAAP